LLLSMTGFGEARRQTDGLVVSIELRTINNRYFKLNAKCSERYASLESEIENVVRQQIRRGTVSVNLRIDRAASPDDYKLNTAVLASYREQLEHLHAEWHVVQPVSLETLLALPGVVIEQRASGSDAAEVWPVIQETLEAAMANLAKMRIEEGRDMANDLRANCRLVAAELKEIAGRAPLVVEAYRSRLNERLKTVLADHQVSLDPADVIKEVSIYAERSDISEEIVRLGSHLEQFDEIMELAESSGRKLEFLTQEMFRETNTIGSKANDVQIARHVIDIKAAIERIREMIQNVE